MAKKRTTAKPVKRTAKGTFVKGTSGNPGGRPKSMADAIRAKCRDGNEDELLDIAFAGVRGEPLGADLKKLREAGIDIAQGLEKSLGILPPAERVKLLCYLLDQQHGKARQGVEVTGKDGGPIQSETKAVAEDVDPERLLKIARLLGDLGALPREAAGAAAAPDAADDAVHPAPAAPDTGGVPPP